MNQISCSHRTRANKVFAEFVKVGEGLIRPEMLNGILSLYAKHIEQIQYFKNWRIWLWLTIATYKLADNFTLKKEISKSYWPIVMKTRAISTNPDAQKQIKAFFVRSEFTPIDKLMDGFCQNITIDDES